MNLELMVGRVGGSELVDGYVNGSAGARAFYSGWWGDPEAYKAKAREVDGRFDRTARRRAADAMYAPGANGAERLDEWVERGGYLVTAGQQPGLFTGPIYTLSKALMAVTLAKELEALLESPVLPLFWVASDDHDWEEANHTVVVGVDNELHRIEVEVPADQLGLPLHSIRPGAALSRAREALFSQLPRSDFSKPYERLIETAYHPGATLAEGFRDALATLLAPFGVLLADGADPSVKALSSSILQGAIEESPVHEAALEERAKALDGAGFHVQVPVLAEGVNVFLEGPDGRERLYREGDGFRLRHSGQRISAPELLQRLRDEPGSFSPNVLLRPVVESAVFPTVSLVTGPGETSYAAQLQPLFGAFGIEPPVTYPRLAVTALEAKIGKVLDKFGFEASELDRPFHELAVRVAREELPEVVEQTLKELRSGLGKGAGRLLEEARDIDPTLKGAIESARTSSLGAWDDAEKKILQALKRGNEVGLRQLAKARLHLYPNGSPQERVMTPFYYLFRYGGEFLEGLHRSLSEGAVWPHPSS